MISKFIKLANAIFSILKKPSLLNLILESNTVQKEQAIISFGLPAGLRMVTLENLGLNTNITINIFSNSGGGSTTGDLFLLCALAKVSKAENYFEIGTWRGESIANVSSYVKNCYTLNLSDQELTSLGCNNQYVKQHRMFSKSIPNCQHLFGDSQTFDYTPFFGKMDLVFVDGNHHPENIKHDSEIAFKLINERGIIVWHDYLDHGHDIRWEVLNGILNGSPKNLRQHIYNVSNTLCAIYWNKNINSKTQELYEKPSAYFSLDSNVISLKSQN